MSDKNSTGDQENFGHAFVGNYLCLCARVEDWTISVILKAQQLDRSGKKTKMPHLFGLKLRAVRELATASPTLFNKPSRIVDLMDRFTEPAKMRSNLAHAVVRTAADKTANYWLFHNVGTNDRFWLLEEQMKSELTELKKLVKEITDQKLKAITPASSPRQP
jgi:hypothetical protein